MWPAEGSVEGPGREGGDAGRRWVGDRWGQSGGGVEAAGVEGPVQEGRRRRPVGGDAYKAPRSPSPRLRHPMYPHLRTGCGYKADVGALCGYLPLPCNSSPGCRQAANIWRGICFFCNGAKKNQKKNVRPI